jgi:choline kinase
MLAAGRGTRLFGPAAGQPPKSLLRFDGASLLARHLEALAALGVADLTVVTGYGADQIEDELSRAPAGLPVRTIYNPRFERGALVSLWTAREILRSGDDVLFMDADVLYHRGLLERLCAAAARNCLLFDANFEPGEDPVMICLAAGRIAEFGKQVPGRFERVGEWPGFARLEPRAAARFAGAAEAQVAAGDLDAAYEPALRRAILDPDVPAFGIADVSDLPWIEIDYPEDLERARGEIMRRLRPARRSGTPCG